MRSCRCVHASVSEPRPLVDTWSSRKSANATPEKVPRVGDEPELPVVARVVALHHVVVPRPAELQRVAPLQPGEALVDLEHAVVGVAAEADRADVGHVVAHADLGEAGDGLRPTDAELVVQLAEVAQVERRAVERVVVVADEQVVDDVGAEDAVPVAGDAPERVLAERPVEQRHGRLLGLGEVRLLRVAHVDLVVGRGVPVDLDVVLVRALRGRRLAEVVLAEVRERARRRWRADTASRRRTGCGRTG